jgi:hypothetical protein
MTYVSTRWQLAVGIERSKHMAVGERPDAATGLYGESGPYEISTVRGANGSIFLGRLYKLVS